MTKYFNAIKLTFFLRGGGVNEALSEIEFTLEKQ